MTSVNLPESAVAELTLATVTGPTPISLPLSPPGPITIGRASEHTLELNDTHVSRHHATFTFSEGEVSRNSTGWLLCDAGSRHGTWLNGVRVVAGRQVPLRVGDLVLISPWTFRVNGPAAESPAPMSMATLADMPHTTVAQMDTRSAALLAQERLALLLDCASAIHSAADEAALSKILIDVAVSGTGFANAAMLRPISAATVSGPAAAIGAERVEVIAHRGSILGADAAPTLSRSLVRQAASGVPVRLLSRDQEALPTHSIVELGIEEALCVPLVMEGTIAGILYLDNRGGERTTRRVSGDAGAFAIGLARMGALALANLNRLDVERRHARMEAELNAAGKMQSMLMPRREGRHGPFSYTGASRPGRYVGGDFFDVVPLGDGRIAVAVGDVAGKGVVASVLITTTYGFLHAALLQHGDPGRAVTDLNRFLEPRCPDDKFLTLWLGVFDANTNTLHSVDAGHGHAFSIAEDGALEPLSKTTCYPVGVMPENVYQAETRTLPTGGRAIVLSDGLLEERGPDSSSGDPSEALPPQFEVAGVQSCMSKLQPGEDEVAALFAAVENHAGRTALADDATAVLLRWGRER